jgi:K+-sensing histidine kinase KdpD
MCRYEAHWSTLYKKPLHLSVALHVRDHRFVTVCTDSRRWIAIVVHTPPGTIPIKPAQLERHPWLPWSTVGVQLQLHVLQKASLLVLISFAALIQRVWSEFVYSSLCSLGACVCIQARASNVALMMVACGARVYIFEIFFTHPEYSLHRFHGQSK